MMRDVGASVCATYAEYAPARACTHAHTHRQDALGLCSVIHHNVNRPLALGLDDCVKQHHCQTPSEVPTLVHSRHLQALLHTPSFIRPSVSASKAGARGRRLQTVMKGENHLAENKRSKNHRVGGSSCCSCYWFLSSDLCCSL